MVSNNKAIGRMGEDEAIAYLQKKGYSIVDKNFACRKGEIDIIAKLKSTIIFVEVKKRTSSKNGIGAEAVNGNKIRRIIDTANYYIMINNLELLYRFDVISIDSGVINHIENAFQSEG